MKEKHRMRKRKRKKNKKQDSKNNAIVGTTAIITASAKTNAMDQS